MKANKTTKEVKEHTSSNFNYYQDLDSRIEGLMEELRGIRAVAMQHDDSTEMSETNNSENQKQKPANT